MIITVARQLGAGGGAVARRVADSLGWRLLDRALVERIAGELKVAPEDVEACDERVESFVERLGLFLSEGFPEALPLPSFPPLSADTTARAARQVISAVVEEGPCVIVGHGSQCVLQADLRACHALVHAPFALRVERAAARYGVPWEQAREMIRRTDADRQAYIREHFQRDWLSPNLYHLCVDAGRLGEAAAADLVQATAQRLFGL